MKNKIMGFFFGLRFLFIQAGVRWKDPLMTRDVERWCQVTGRTGSVKKSLPDLLWTYPEFRSLFIYRNQFRPVYKRWVGLIYPPLSTLYIQAGHIGGGLYIQHGFSTMITARSIGEDCWINQQVTIGYRGQGDAPVIGNNVMITCGAKVLGEITVGDNAVIGANAVVIHDVEENAVMGGVPARRLK